MRKSQLRAIISRLALWTGVTTGAGVVMCMLFMFIGFPFAATECSELNNRDYKVLQALGHWIVSHLPEHKVHMHPLTLGTKDAIFGESGERIKELGIKSVF